VRLFGVVSESCAGRAVANELAPQREQLVEREGVWRQRHPGRFGGKHHVAFPQLQSRQHPAPQAEAQRVAGVPVGLVFTSVALLATAVFLLFSTG